MREAQTIVPGPANANPAVATIQRTVIAKSHFFFSARASATAPITGIARRLAAFESAITHVQTNVAQSASPATTETKYALKTAVSTTVV